MAISIIVYVDGMTSGATYEGANDIADQDPNGEIRRYVIPYAAAAAIQEIVTLDPDPPRGRRAAISSWPPKVRVIYGAMNYYQCENPPRHALPRPNR